jgi:hypothetical protein
MSNKISVEDRLSKVSNNYIKDMLVSVRKAFEHDAELTEEQKVQFQYYDQDGAYYGTDVYSDWKEWREMLEYEAERRGLGI